MKKQNNNETKNKKSSTKNCNATKNCNGCGKNTHGKNKYEENDD